MMIKIKVKFENLSHNFLLKKTSDMCDNCMAFAQCQGK